MAYEYHDSETGEQGIGGQPSSTERHHGEAVDEKRNGEVYTFEELYGGDE